VQNEEAEELMRKVEKEEEVAAGEHPEKQCLHLCIINLVIGTLYCAKVNGIQIDRMPLRVLQTCLRLAHKIGNGHHWPVGIELQMCYLHHISLSTFMLHWITQSCSSSHKSLGVFSAQSTMGL
jgi:hypothetical protein